MLDLYTRHRSAYPSHRNRPLICVYACLQNDGIRLLQVQSHLVGSTINLCHSSCTLQSSGPFTSYLSTLATWMTAHPEDVVTLLITNPESLSPATFAADFVSAGLDALAYVPPQSTTARDEWPTLGELIDSGKRLVVFMDYGADFSAAPYIIDGAVPLSGGSCCRGR